MPGPPAEPGVLACGTGELCDRSPQTLVRSSASGPTTTWTRGSREGQLSAFSLLHSWTLVFLFLWLNKSGVVFSVAWLCFLLALLCLLCRCSLFCLKKKSFPCPWLAGLVSRRSQNLYPNMAATPVAGAMRKKVLKVIFISLLLDLVRDRYRATRALEPMADKRPFLSRYPSPSFSRCFRTSSSSTEISKFRKRTSLPHCSRTFWAISMHIRRRLRAP